MGRAGYSIELLVQLCASVMTSTTERSYGASSGNCYCHQVVGAKSSVAQQRFLGLRGLVSYAKSPVHFGKEIFGRRGKPLRHKG